ncbi:MAG: NACHT domain-containing protein [Legionellaceae bacterium]|nr:NACHT domain-containing protein [Legionellaceae bacterium]
MGFSSRQDQFNRDYMFRVNSLLDDLFSSITNSPDWQSALQHKLDQGSALVGAAVATVGVATLAAPVTAGGSLVAAGAVLGTAAACIVIVQAANGGYKVVTRASNDKITPQTEEETSLEENKLFFSIILQEVADIVTMRYGNFIDEIIEQDSIAAFAYYGAERVIKKLQVELRDQLSLHAKSMGQSQKITFTLNPIEFADYLMHSAHLPVFRASEKIKLKDKYTPSGFMSSNIAPVKWPYARSRVAFYYQSISDGSVIFHYYSSSPESTHFSNHTTLPQYGYAALQAPLPLVSTISMDNREIEELPNQEDIDSAINPYLSVYYIVSAEEIIGYLDSIDREAAHPKLSLNAYLSDKLKINVIAECHDDSLIDIDLSGGDYSEVNFRRATLCGSLVNTVWKSARLMGIQLSGNPMTNSDFSHALLEKSEISNLTLTGNFSYAKMNGTILKNSIIGQLVDIGCDWGLVHMDENVHMSMGDDEWRAKTEERWTNEFRKRHTEAEELRQEFNEWQLEQEEKWSHQEEINDEYSRHIKSIEQWQHVAERQPIIDVLNIIRNYGRRFIERTISEPYIDLQINPAGVGENISIPLANRLLQFMNDPMELFFLLHGPIGSGKTTSLSRFVQEVLLSCQKTDDVYPILIKLRHVQDKTTNNFLEQCLLTQFGRSEIEVLKKHFRCVIVLDGLDECGIKYTKRYLLEECLAFNQDCAKGSWKILISASSQLLLEVTNYRERLRFSEDVHFPFESEYSLLPLTHSQINTYIQRYYPVGVNLADGRFQDLYTMAQTPVMLHIVCEVVSQQDPLKELPTTRVEFYQNFLNNWSSHVLQKAEMFDLTPKSILLYLQDIAYQMFTESSNQVEVVIDEERDPLEIARDSDQNSNQSPSFNYIFDNPLWRKAGTLAPMNVVRDENRQVIIYQVRAPFRLYALATKLVEILRKPPRQRLTGWNYGYLTEPTTVSVFDSLAELVNMDPKKKYLIQSLCGIVSASCTEDGARWSKAASNAITLLVYLGFDFSAELDHSIWRNLNVPKAILRYGKFSGFDISHGNISESKLHGAELVDVKMEGTNVRSAQFFDGMSILHTGRHPEAFAIYPSDKTIIAYSVLKKSGSPEREIILAGMNGAKYPKIPGHQTEITCMAWGVEKSDKEIARLASASVHGTIRIWQIEGVSCREVAILKCSKKKPINSLRWFKNGKLLASGGEDQILRIWDVGLGKCVYSCHLTSSINSVLFGRDKDIILSVEDNGNLRVWALRDIKRGGNHEHSSNFVQPSPVTVQCAAHSVALAVPESHVAVGYANGNIVVFNIEIIDSIDNNPTEINIEMINILHGHSGVVNTIIWNSHCLVSGSDDGMVIVWSPQTGIRTAVYHGDGSPVKKVAWLTGGRQLIAGQNRMLSIYDPDYRLESFKAIQGLTSLITCIAPLEDIIAMGHIDGKVVFLDLSTLPRKTEIFSYSHLGSIEDISWSCDGLYLASIGVDNAIMILDRRSLIMGEPNVFRIENTSKVNRIDWLVDPKSQDAVLVMTLMDGCIHFWMRAQDERTNTWERSSYIAWGTPDNAPMAIATRTIMSEVTGLTSTHFVVSSGENIKIWSITNLADASLILVREHVVPIEYMAWSQDGRYLMTKDIDQNIFVWNPATWKMVWKDPLVSDKKVVIWALSPEGQQWLVVGTVDEIRFFNALSEENSLIKIKTIYSSVDNLAYHLGNIYLGDKKSVDMLNFEIEVDESNPSSSFITRFGHGTCVRGLDLRESRHLSKQAKRFLKHEGAILRDEEEKFSFSKAAFKIMGFNRSSLSVLPQPVQIKSTSERKVHSFYRSDSSLAGESTPSSSSSPKKSSSQSYSPSSEVEELEGNKFL